MPSHIAFLPSYMTGNLYCIKIADGTVLLFIA